MISELKVGPSVNQDGAQITLRAGKDGATVVLDAHARYQEAVYRGGVFSAANQASTSTPAGLVAASAALTGFILYNPIASGKNAVLWNAQTALGAVVVTGSTGVIGLAGLVGPNLAAPTTAGTTTLTPINALIGGNSNKPVCTAYSTATFAQAPVAIKVIGGVQAIGTLAADIDIYQWSVPLDGEFILAPGSAVCFFSTTVEPLQSSMTWEEVAI